MFISSPEDIEVTSVTSGGRCDSKGIPSNIEEISSCSSIGCGCCGDDGGGVQWSRSKLISSILGAARPALDEVEVMSASLLFMFSSHEDNYRIEHSMFDFK